MSADAWRQARDILCIRLDYLGDVLMCTPAIRALRESVPGRRITLMTSAGGSAVARHIPEVDAAIEYAAPWMKSSAPHDAAHDLAMAETLRARRFDAAVIFTTYSQSPLPAALLCYLAGIPLRIAHCRENPYQLLTHWVSETEPQHRIRHEVRRQLDLVAETGAATADLRLSFSVPAEDSAWAEQRLRSAGIVGGKPWVLMHPGASAASRRYPSQHWARAAGELARRIGCPMVFTGSASEAALVEEIRVDAGGAVESHSLAGELDLGKLAAVIRLAPVMVSNNTGPAHIAAAVGTPVVDLYALTNPQHTPWQVPCRVLYHLVPCRNCYKSVCPQGHHDCLVRVPPEQVADAAIELLHAGRRQRFAPDFAPGADHAAALGV